MKPESFYGIHLFGLLTFGMPTFLFILNGQNNLALMFFLLTIITSLISAILMFYSSKQESKNVN